MQMRSTDLRSRREAAGLTQAQLAARLGVGRVTVNRWEHDVQPISRIAALAITAVLQESRPMTTIDHDAFVAQHIAHSRDSRLYGEGLRFLHNPFGMADSFFADPVTVAVSRLERADGSAVILVTKAPYPGKSITAPLNTEPFASLIAGDQPERWGYPKHETTMDARTWYTLEEHDNAESTWGQLVQSARSADQVALANTLDSLE